MGRGVGTDKQVLIIAGPNGAGKTTFARTFLASLKDQIRFINADCIAAGLSPFDPERVAVRAGRIMLEEVEACVQRGESFAIETTPVGAISSTFGAGRPLATGSHSCFCR